MLCLVCYLFVISTSVIDCPGRFVPEMTCYVSSGTLNLTKPNQAVIETSCCITCLRLPVAVRPGVNKGQALRNKQLLIIMATTAACTAFHVVELARIHTTRTMCLYDVQ